MTSLPHCHETRLSRARLALEGLSVGDALGQQFFNPWLREWCIPKRQVPDGPWPWTDDTAMALEIHTLLTQRQGIEQDELARGFARRYMDNPNRGYGPAQHRLLREIDRGADWRIVGHDLFRGEGSFGNGGAMRAAPIGGYFADNLDEVVRHAALSAEITHAHPDGQAGAVAVAVAAAWAWQWNADGRRAPKEDLIRATFQRTPPSPTRNAIEVALTNPLDDWEFTAVNFLGDGSNITARDTVPFCLWVAAKHLDDYKEALWTAIRVHGDIDTNCAIIGGIVALANGLDAIPSDWRARRERLDAATQL